MHIAEIRKLLTLSTEDLQQEFIILKLQERLPKNINTYTEFVAYLETTNYENIQRKKFLAIRNETYAQLRAVVENYYAQCSAENLVAENITCKDFLLKVK